MSDGDLCISADGTHHIRNGKPAYPSRFERVEKFHPPGMAPARDDSGAFHILASGLPAYDRRFERTFGFYENRAAVTSVDGCHHILPDGADLYQEGYSWVGNFQEAKCTVRDNKGYYFYIELEGHRLSEKAYLYAGDFRNGIAVVRELDGLCKHVDDNENQVHGGKFLDLDVYHKGFARARDSQGWFHIDINGRAAYEERFSEVEPFYNGFSLVKHPNGEISVIDEYGRIAHRVLDERSSHVKDDLRNRLMNMLVGYWKTQIVKSIVELGILDHIKEGYDSIEKISKEANLPEQSVVMVLNILRVWNMVEERNGEYHLRYSGELLTQGHPRSLRSAALMWGEEHYMVMSRLTEALRTSSPQFRSIYGAGFFQHFAEKKDKGRTYNEAMEEYAHDYDDVLSLCDFSDTRVLVDVGGGRGQLLSRITEENEHIEKGILFDLPSAVAQARDSPRLGKAEKRIELIAGDFFDSLPVEADTVILSRVLHDWNDDDAVAILKNVRESLVERGKLLILETVVPKDATHDLGHSLNFNLLVTVGGRERTREEFEDILQRAGFGIEDVRRGKGILSAITARADPRGR